MSIEVCINSGVGFIIVIIDVKNYGFLYVRCLEVMVVGFEEIVFLMNVVE